MHSELCLRSDQTNSPRGQRCMLCKSTFSNCDNKNIMTNILPRLHHTEEYPIMNIWQALRKRRRKSEINCKHVGASDRQDKTVLWGLPTRHTAVFFLSFFVINSYSSLLLFNSIHWFSHHIYRLPLVCERDHTDLVLSFYKSLSPVHYNLT